MPVLYQPAQSSYGSSAVLASGRRELARVRVCMLRVRNVSDSQMGKAVWL